MPYRRSMLFGTMQPGGSALPAAPVPKTFILRWSIVAALIAAAVGGAELDGAAFTTIACAAILLFGLPHGTLDLEIVRKEHGSGIRSMTAVLLLYLGLAAGMWALWSLWPTAALCLFLCVAIVHFAKDWPELNSSFLAQGMSSAVLTMPVWLHSDQLRGIFTALTSNSDAVIVTDLLLLLAPTSMAVAAVGLWTLWRADHRQSSITISLTLIGMAMLPPVVGFACFFCLFHSPRHFADALVRVSDTPHMRTIIVLVSLAALGLAAVLFRATLQIELSARFIAASFMTLSLLTLPHMTVPFIVHAIAGRRNRLRLRQLKGEEDADQGPARIRPQG